MGSVGEMDNILSSRKARIKIKRKIHDEYILPVMTWLRDIGVEQRYDG